MPWLTNEFDFRWLPDGRNMRLLMPVSYKTKEGLVITVSAGEETDGASIPRILWSVEGSPFCGKYRFAAIIHDYLCRHQVLTFKRTHKIFYEAMLDSGVGKFEALKKYSAVRIFGPKW